MAKTLSARGYSEEEVRIIENIVEDSDYLGSKSDFIRTTSQYAVAKNLESFEPTVDNFEEKIDELGLDQLSFDKLNYFDTLTSAYTLAEDPDITDGEYRNMMGELAERRLKEDFPDSSLTENLLE
ncbi:MAG: hypothetical protein ACI8Z7_000226 [Candidatus Nanohaloarchaea archaeon]|jgi:hypothetical protein